MLISFFRAIWQNTGTLLLAFALALAVWLSSVVSDNPNLECTAPSSIPLELIGQDPSLELLTELPARIQIQYFAPRSTCAELAEQGVDSAKLDITGLGSGTHTIQVDIPSVDKSPLRVLSYSPTEIDVALEQIVSVTLPLVVEITGEPALGFQAGDPSIDVAELTVTGPESQVSQVTAARAFVDISGARETLSRNLGIQLLDAEGQTVSGLVMSPSRVVFSLPISQLGRYRELAVQVNTEGQWATGYRLTSISVSPPTVTVFSEDPNRVNALPGFVETEPIDLTDAQDDIAATVALDLPDGVTLVGRETVFVQVSIAAIEDNLIVTLPIEILGLSPEFDVSLSPETVEVILFGPLPVLENLTASNVRVVIDLTGLAEGTWQVEPLVDILPDQVQEQGINPATVEVTITVLPTPTPTPVPPATPAVGS